MKTKKKISKAKTRKQPVRKAASKRATKAAPRPAPKSVKVKTKALPQPKLPELFRIEWDPKQERDHQTAERFFVEQLRAGKLVFEADEKWNLKECLKNFDKNPGRMVVMLRPTAWDKITGEDTP